MEHESSFLCSQDLVTGPYPEPDESSPHSHILPHISGSPRANGNERYF